MALRIRDLRKDNDFTQKVNPPQQAAGLFIPKSTSGQES